MVSIKEITSSLYGAYRLARMDPDALQYFNISASGFYRSFAAVFLALPFFLIENAIDYKKLETATSFVPFLILLGIALAVSWMSYLIAAGFFARLLDFFQQFTVFVIVYNWSQLAIVIVWLPLSVLSTGFLNIGLSSIISLLFIAATYVYLWRILRITLGISGLLAVGFAFLEFMIAILTQVLFSDFLITTAA
ncbi:hypothetical protein NBZ79_02030 [Sneathiella marina]|uniref:Yip1 domain-containing protein n=1 Tax=Sneathiella marina TaxID=2950108 RepID=A0ABY4WAR6_9PROT|nr:hypothetical protein [Sneathiella marina]USG61751.1 hypothetical protein NBZ79_02030 [Sneathiella marina]